MEHPDYFVIAMKYLMDIWGLSETEVAHAAGVAQTTVSNLVTGRRKGRPETRYAIAKGMGKTYPEMIDLGRDRVEEGLSGLYRNPKALQLVRMIEAFDKDGNGAALDSLFRIATREREVAEEMSRYRDDEKTGTNE